MKAAAVATLVLTVVFNRVSAADAAPGRDAAKAPAAEAEVEIAPSKEGAEASAPTNDVADFCFFSGTPPADVKYTVIKKLKVGKGTYGGVKDILPKFAGYARRVGADAIIGYTGSQRFGVLPWRVVRPVVRGVAIKWSDTQGRDCTAMGGTTLKTILATDQPPSQ
jgi:hypothetical protein